MSEDPILSAEPRDLAGSRARRFVRWTDGWARLARLAHATAAGLGLAWMDRATLHAIEAAMMARTVTYGEPEYNRSGLRSWEREAVESFFPARGRVVVWAAGGGREILALARLGFEVVGFECHADLREAAHRLLAEESVAAEVLPIRPDAPPPRPGERYEAGVLGLGALSLVAGKAVRSALLEGIASGLEPKSPVLVSFLVRAPGLRADRWTAAVANGARRFFPRRGSAGKLSGDPTVRGLPVYDHTEVGDGLQPAFAHRFTEESLRQELQSAGWAVLHQAVVPYGHAVALTPG